MSRLKLHPACTIFPQLPEAELEALAEDIRRNGLINPIVTLDGKVLDGRNRLAACQIAKVKPRFIKWKGKGSPIAWVVATNLMRRHLTASQRAIVAFDLLPLLEKEAKGRQRRSGGRGKKVAKELASNSDLGKASQHAARLTHANSTYVEKIKAVSRSAPELLPRIRSAQITIPDAVRLAKLPSAELKKVLTQADRHPEVRINRLARRVATARQANNGSRKRPSKAKVSVWCGDCLELLRRRIANESVSIVTTSPPYNQGLAYGEYFDSRPELDYLKWLNDIFQELRRVLTSDGSLFLVVGHTPKRPWTAMRTAEVAGKHFVLQNQIVWVKSVHVDGRSHGHFSPVQGQRFLNRTWEYVFHFSKSGDVPLDRLAIGVPYEARSNSDRTGSPTRCSGDVWFIPHTTVHGSEDRADHPATFPPELAERCIKLAGIKADTVVLDPFCGVNGMIAPVRLGVRGIGIDIDPAYCSAAIVRANAASAGVSS